MMRPPPVLSGGGNEKKIKDLFAIRRATPKKRSH
jgi:hypothetical protein